MSCELIEENIRSEYRQIVLLGIQLLLLEGQLMVIY